MPDMTERAMLARLTIHLWTARRHDKKASADVADAHHADHDSGRYIKRLVAKDALLKVSAAAGELRRYFTEHTLPWFDEGQRVLPAVEYFEVADGLRRRRTDFDAEVRTFIGAYPALRASAPVVLGSLYQNADYPGLDEIASKFGIEFRVAPLPIGNDFRVALDTDLEAELRGQITEDTKNALAEAHRSLWLRVHETLSNSMERLRAYTVDEDGKVTRTFRDSAILNIRELVDLLPRLNIAGDVELDRMCQRLRDEICGMDPAELRENEATRQTVIAAGKNALDDMAWLIGPAKKAAA